MSGEIGGGDGLASIIGDPRGKDLRIGITDMEGQGSVTTDLFFVAVHVGAGFHDERKAKAYKLAMRRACQAAASVLSQVLDRTE